MSGSQLIELAVGGLAIGCIYSLIALGFTMIIRATGVLHFAQGEVVMLGAMFGLTAFRLVPLPFIGLFIVGMVLGGLAAAAIELGVYRTLRVRRVPLMNIIIATVGMSILLQNGSQLAWGSEERVTVRRRDIAPLVDDLIEWMKQERAKLSRHNEVAKAMDYMLKRIDVFTRFLDDGRICLSNNAAERELRGIALGRKSWLFAGSDRGGKRAAIMLTLIHTALCRSRHKAVYAARRTMPSGPVFPSIPHDRPVVDSA